MRVTSAYIDRIARPLSRSCAILYGRVSWDKTAGRVPRETIGRGNAGVSHATRGTRSALRYPAPKVVEEMAYAEDLDLPGGCRMTPSRGVPGPGLRPGWRPERGLGAASGPGWAGRAGLHRSASARWPLASRCGTGTAGSVPGAPPGRRDRAPGAGWPGAGARRGAGAAW